MWGTSTSQHRRRVDIMPCYLILVPPPSKSFANVFCWDFHGTGKVCPMWFGACLKRTMAFRCQHCMSAWRGSGLEVEGGFKGVALQGSGPGVENNKTAPGIHREVQQGLQMFPCAHYITRLCYMQHWHAAHNGETTVHIDSCAGIELLHAPPAAFKFTFLVLLNGICYGHSSMEDSAMVR